MNCPACNRPIEATDARCIHCRQSLVVDIYDPPKKIEGFKLYKLKYLPGYFALYLVLMTITWAIAGLYALVRIWFELHFIFIPDMEWIKMIIAIVLSAVFLTVFFWVKEVIFENYD